MNKKINPWPHFLFDETFSHEDFLAIQQIMLRWPKPEPGGRIMEDLINLPNSEIILDKLKRQIYPILLQVAAANFPTCILKRPENFRFSSLMYKTEYNIQAKGHIYKIHCDASNKLVSIITHVSNEGVGTHLYDERQNLSCTLPWKPNSSFLFTNSHNSFHSFSSDVNYRVTLTSTLELTERAFNYFSAQSVERGFQRATWWLE